MNLKKILLSFYLLLVIAIRLQAQADYSLTDSTFFEVSNVKLLADKAYNFQQILNDTSLPFKIQSLSSKGLEACWLKATIHNPYPYDKVYSVRANPLFSNTFYTLDAITNQWKTTQAGYLQSNQTTVFNYAPCVFKSNATTTFYVKISAQQFSQLNYQLPIRLSFEKLEITQKNANQKFIWWCVTVSIMLAFFLYNLYLYFMFKDVVYLYYLLILVGVFCYITSYNFYCSLFTSFKSVQVSILANGTYNYLPFDRAVMQLALAFILTIFVVFTRCYLQTKITMPRWDTILKFTAWLTSIILSGITFLEVAGVIPITDLISALQNISSIIVIILILLVAIIGVKKKLAQAKYYLLAQSIPFLIMLLLASSLFLGFNESWTFKFLPNIAILAQTITFAIALVARVNLLKNELHFNQISTEQATSQLAFEQEKNQRLQDKVEHDKKELAAAQQIKLLMKELHHRVKNNLQIVSSLLSLQSFRIKDKVAAEAVKEGQHRIEAMSLIHQRLYTTDNITEVNIKEYITDLSESLMQAYGYNKNEFDLVLKVTDELMNVDKAIPLSLIINELVTNAFKYAYTKEIKPQLTVALNSYQGYMELLIHDNGKGIDMAIWQNNTGSYGKELVHTFTKQLNGILEVINENGTKFTIRFPL